MDILGHRASAPGVPGVEWPPDLSVEHLDEPEAEGFPLVTTNWLIIQLPGGGPGISFLLVSSRTAVPKVRVAATALP